MARIRSLNDIEAMERVSLGERALPSSTYALLQRGAAVDPEGTALIFFLQGTAYRQAVRYTHRDFIGQVTRTANLFGSLGIGPGDVVSYVLPNLPETLFCLWGGEAAGIVNPINPLLAPEEIADIMRAAGTKVLVTLAPFPKVDLWDKVDAVRTQVPSLETILLVDLARYLSGPKRWLVKAMAWPRRPKQAGGGPRLLDFHDELARHPADRLQHRREIEPDDLASYFHTGGTTGRPKLAGRTHANEVYNAWAGAQVVGAEPGKVTFCGLPLFHANAAIVSSLAQQGVGAALVLGTPQGYRGPGVLENFWKIAAHYRINSFSGVPAVYSRLLDLPVGESDLSTLEFAICGAAPLPVEVFRAFEAKTGVRILEGYGLTEGTCISAVNPPDGERRVGSIGLRLPYQEMKTVLLDEGGAYRRECEPGEIGTVVIRGPNVFSGYKEEAHNRGLWVDTGDGGPPWLNTGDLGRRDEDGYFWLTGRRKELIIRGGHNIDPASIEGVLHEHPAVALAAAVGRPDPRVGELPVAYVQLKPGTSVTSEELLRFAADRIREPAAVPKAVRIVDELPLTAVGKIFKPQLCWREAEDVLRAEVAALGTAGAVHAEAGPDPQHGTLVRLQVTPAPGTDRAALERKLRERLGRYALTYALEFRRA